MPKFGIHYNVLDEVINKLKVRGHVNDPQGQESKRLADILSHKDNRWAANLGAIGPDLLFWAPDYVVVQKLLPLVEAYDKIEPTIDNIKKLVKGIEDSVDKTKDQIIHSLENLPFVGPAITTAVDYITLLSAIKDELTVQVSEIKSQILTDLPLVGLGLDGTLADFTLFRSILQGQFQASNQIGREETEWYWFEMLHYRNTGDFVKELISLADTDLKKAYAFGYATHYATDVVGHPYVNTISGAPYRISVQRHVVIENYMDQWKWTNTYFDNIDPEIDNDPNDDAQNVGAANPMLRKANIRHSLFSRFQFEDHPELPKELAAMISKALENTYKSIPDPADNTKTIDLLHPQRFNDNGLLTPADIQTAYTFQRHFLELFGGKKEVQRPVEPFPGANALVADLVAGIENAAPSMTAAQNTSNSNPTPPADDLISQIEEWFNSLVNTVKELINRAEDIINEVGNVIAAVAAAGNGDIIQDVRRDIAVLAYAAELSIYDFYRYLNQIMALSGFAYPEPEDVALAGDPGVMANPIAQSLITISPDVTDVKPDGQFKGNLLDGKKSGFPILRFPGQPHLDRRSYLEFRNNPLHFSRLENPTTVSSFYHALSTPDVFIKDSPLDITLMKLYAACIKPEDTRDLYGSHPGSFGNAIDMSIEILLRRNDVNSHPWIFCNWNMDGDRGYGYKSWDAVPVTVMRDEIDSVVTYDGAERNEFVQQNLSVWSSVELNNNNVFEYKFKDYISKKKKDDSFIATLTISETSIPKKFDGSSNIFCVPPYTVTVNEWINLLPSRLKPTGNRHRDNFVFVNGIFTPASAGVRAMMVLRKALETACNADPDHTFPIQYLHNYSSREWGDLYLPVDIMEVINDYIYAVQATAFINRIAGVALPEISNPTQISVMAYLHAGMEGDKPLLISGHSQGAMITGNAVLAFSAISNKHKNYLRNKVKLCHFEPEIIKPAREMIRSLVKEYLVYIVTKGDNLPAAGPVMSDLLPELFSGDLPLLPLTATGILTQGTVEADYLNTLNQAMGPQFDAESYAKLMAETLFIGNDSIKVLRSLIPEYKTMSIDVHFITSQMILLNRDIANNRFRADPATVQNLAPNTNLSTANNNGNPKSVNVKNFFTS